VKTKVNVAYSIPRDRTRDGDRESMILDVIRVYDGAVERVEVAPLYGVVTLICAFPDRAKASQAEDTLEMLCLHTKGFGGYEV